MTNRRALLAAAAAAPWVARPAAAQGTALRLAHFAAESHPGHVASRALKEAVERRTDGALRIEIYPANQLGAPPDQLEQTRLGVVDMNLPTQGALDKFERAFATVMSPFAYRDAAHAHAVLDGPFNAWAAPLLERQGLVLLANWEYGFRNVTNSRRPINAPDDMRGLRLRTPPEIQLVAAMEALGARATQIAFPELPAALNQGVVDGQENPIGVIWHSKLYETQPHLALTRHSYNSMVHVMNLQRFRRLPPAQQAVLREESVAAGLLMRRLNEEQEADELGRIEAAGVAVTRPDLAPFRERMAPAYERIAGYAGRPNMDRFLAMLG